MKNKCQEKCICPLPTKIQSYNSGCCTNISSIHQSQETFDVSSSSFPNVESKTNSVSLSEKNKKDEQTLSSSIDEIQEDNECNILNIIGGLNSSLKEADNNADIHDKVSILVNSILKLPSAHRDLGFMKVLNICNEYLKTNTGL